MNQDQSVCQETTAAYHEAMSICQWNLRPSNLNLLKVAKNYALHLGNINNFEHAITVLKGVIEHAQKDLSEKNPTNKSSVEALLNELIEYLQHFRLMYNEQPARVVELIAPEFELYIEAPAPAG